MGLVCKNIQESKKKKMKYLFIYVGFCIVIFFYLFKKIKSKRNVRKEQLSDFFFIEIESFSFLLIKGKNLLEFDKLNEIHSEK